MATATMAVEQDVKKKIDLEYVEQQLADADVAFFFSCTNDNEWQDETLETHDGKPLFVIKLNYKSVKRMKPENVRKLMLTLAKQRLAA